MQNKYIFWIRSSKGTDIQEIVKLDSDLNKNAIRLELERWCDRFGAFHVSDTYCSYGWAFANSTNLKKLSQYRSMKKGKHKQIDLLIDKKITTKDFSTWLNNNKKKMLFPFK